MGWRPACAGRITTLLDEVAAGTDPAVALASAGGIARLDADLFASLRAISSACDEQDEPGPDPLHRLGPAAALALEVALVRVGDTRATLAARAEGLAAGVAGFQRAIHRLAAARSSSGYGGLVRVALVAEGRGIGRLMSALVAAARRGDAAAAAVARAAVLRRSSRFAFAALAGLRPGVGPSSPPSPPAVPVPPGAPSPPPVTPAPGGPAPPPAASAQAAQAAQAGPGCMSTSAMSALAGVGTGSASRFTGPPAGQG